MAEKKRTEPDWQDIRVFLALGRHRSLSAAARTLSVNHATIARRIRSLEATLGEKLVERRPDGYVLTAAGTQALAVASDMETAVQTLVRGGTDGAGGWFASMPLRRLRRVSSRSAWPKSRFSFRGWTSILPPTFAR